MARAASAFQFRSQDMSCRNLGIPEPAVAELVERLRAFDQAGGRRAAHYNNTTTTTTTTTTSVRAWPLHLKHTTPLDMGAVLRLPVAHAHTREFLRRVQCFMTAAHYRGLRTSRTIKACALTADEVARAVAMGKFEPCTALDGRATLPYSVGPGDNDHHTYHGVNVFTVPELKGRRRLITEPLLNRVIPKHLVPPVRYETRLGRRQQLRRAKYMLQVDFEAYYDAIPLADHALRDHFVFRARRVPSEAAGARYSYYRLRTLPTGARWSVAVGQAVTWAIVDIDTPVTVLTLIDNILVAAEAGQEADFVRAVRAILQRIRVANLRTSPDRDKLAAMPDAALLELATGPNVFLGEAYEWNGRERLVRNSAKTVAKLQLALAKPTHTIRSLASLVSLVFFALHTTQLNPARAFTLLRAYRGVYRLVGSGAYDWDDPVPYLDAGVRAELDRLGAALVRNPWWAIADERHPSADEADYDAVCVTDASLEGWGGILKIHPRRRDVTEAAAAAPAPTSCWTYRQMWVDDLAEGADAAEAILADLRRRMRAQAHRYRRAGRVVPAAWLQQRGHGPHGGAVLGDPEEAAAVAAADRFHARHSAHAEPRAAQLLLRQLVDVHGLRDGARVALLTDHRAIVVAQKHLNGFGGIGRGHSLNKLYEYAYDLWYERRIDVVFFYVPGPLNPADALSRNFGGDDPTVGSGTLVARHVDPGSAPGVPFLRDTWCPLLPDDTSPPSMDTI